MRIFLILIGLFFVPAVTGCDDDTNDPNGSGGQQPSDGPSDRRDAGSSLVNNVSFPDAARSLVNMGGEQPMTGGDGAGGTMGNLGGAQAAGGSSGGNNTATRVDMGMPDAPEICAELPPPPEAPDISPNVRCARNNEPKRVQDVRAPSCRMNRPDEEDVVIDEAIVTAIFPQAWSSPTVGVCRPRCRRWCIQWRLDLSDRTDFDRNLREGDVVRVEGQRKEFFDLTEIVIASGDGGYQRVGRADVPEPVVVRDPPLSRRTIGMKAKEIIRVN